MSRLSCRSSPPSSTTSAVSTEPFLRPDHDATWIMTNAAGYAGSGLDTAHTGVLDGRCSRHLHTAGSLARGAENAESRATAVPGADESVVQCIRALFHHHRPCSTRRRPPNRPKPSNAPMIRRRHHVYSNAPHAPKDVSAFGGRPALQHLPPPTGGPAAGLHLAHHPNLSRPAWSGTQIWDTS